MIVSFALAYLGLAGLCLGMRRHHSQVFATDIALPVKALRVAGWGLLALGLVFDLLVGNWVFGLVEWIGFLLVSGLIIVLSLAFIPRLIPLLALTSVVLLLSS